MDLMDKLASLAQRYEEVNRLMAQPDVLEDIQLLQRYGREHAGLEEIVQKYHELVDNDKQMAEAQEMYEGDDPEMRELAYEELERLKAQKEQLLNEVKVLLLPKDNMDEKNAIVTVQAGAGGDEAALFAGELFRMYSRYADKRHWKIEVLDANETEQGGIKDMTFDPALFGLVSVQHFYLPVPLISIAAVHTEKLPGKERCLVATCAGLHRDDSVFLVHVVFGQQQHLHLVEQLFFLRFEALKLFVGEFAHLRVIAFVHLLGLCHLLVIVD